MFQVGELIFYGGTGVCQITDVRAMDLLHTGVARPYYILNPLFQECTISAPADSDKVFIRPVLTREEAEELIDRIPFIQAEAYHNRMLHQLEEHYDAALKTHDCGTLLELTMSIYAKKQLVKDQRRKFGMVDERFLKRAEELLFGEFSAALGIPKEEVQSYIQSRVQALEACQNQV